MPGPVTQGRPADNSYCYVCHKDFETEELSAQHAKEGIGCEGCHGQSWPHADDEFNIVPPDVRYGRAEIDAFCKTCHPTHSKGKAYEDFLRKWLNEHRPNGRMVSEDSVCTDCHGNHAILSPDKQIEMMPK